MGVLKPIKVKADVREEDGGEPLSPMASLFHQPNSNIFIIIMIGFKTKINSQVIKANILHTLPSHPRFSSLQVVDETVEGGMKWVPTNVDLDNHVIVPNLEPNDNIDSPDKIVEDYVSNLSKSTIEMSIPLWDLHLLNIKTSYAESMAVYRIHHSLGDGTSLMSLLLASSRKLSDPQALPTLPIMKKKANSSGRFLGNYLIKFWLVLVLYWNTFVDVLKLLATMSMFLKDTETPLKTEFGSTGTTPRRFVHRMVSLDDVKLVKNAMNNVTINDVMVGVTQAGLSRYLNRKYGESKIDKGSSEKYNNLPQNIRFRACSAVNLRPSAGIQELADMMSKGTVARWGNQFGYTLCTFTIALRDDPLEYVRQAKAAMDRKKASLEAYFTYFLTKFIIKFCGVKNVSLPSQMTMQFSNVPGPQEEISYYGHPVAYVAPSCYGQPCVSISNLSMTLKIEFTSIS
ncbi:hypothetical protein LWI29_036100 [Acer saccharum]|uniref:Diacylglycerol O-acyltransferase n=1 Tax=Acer saccharum TaxID=4024 RepID=A0AA39SKC2_ACESA|nr:hypothetical protein LWI29_036100 [Acer saccharum]